MNGKAKILVVDDELPVCRSMASVLTDRNYAVDTALSGEEALQKDSRNHYDVIITDLMMPGISGMDLLKTISEKSPETMIIMVTGYPSIKSAVESVKLGAFDYIPKPFTPSELRSLVSRALSRKRIHEREQAEKDTKKGEITEVSVPEGLYGIPGNAWIRVEKDGMVRIGAHHMLLNTIERIASLEFPEVNAPRYQGEACVIINDVNKNRHRLWTPVTGRIVAINEKIKEDYSKIMKDPYKDGWLLLMTPTHLEDDMKNLIVLKSP